MNSSRVLTGEHFMQGDHACAEGALAAGCTFFAGYPITPSTEIAERLATRLPDVGGVFVQMEDELGSMAAVLGASAAGARAMTATSGPGFSLMMENLGLGVMTEIPCLLVNVQRGSPSTGLPTLPGQSDIMQARWGSHGDYAVVAFSPWSPQEMFDLTVHCFNVADRYRVPVLLMSDEIVGHMVEKVVVPPEGEISLWERKRPKTGPEEPFDPFRPEGPDLVPPMAHAGEGYRVHFTGLTHDERGYPDMTAQTHHELVTRLIKKIRVNEDDIVRVEQYDMQDARIAVVAYGSTARSARSAVRAARRQGIPAGLVRLVSIWPSAERVIKQVAESVDAFVVPEMNLGQMVLEIERLVNQPVVGVHHAGGTMMRPEPVLDKIQEIAKRGS